MKQNSARKSLDIDIRICYNKYKRRGTAKNLRINSATDSAKTPVSPYFSRLLIPSIPITRSKKRRIEPYPGEIWRNFGD